MKEITDDLNHYLTFHCTHNQLFVPQYKSLFRVPGMYTLGEAIATATSGRLLHTTTTTVEGSATAFVRCPAFFLVREKLQHEFEANLQMALSLF